MTVRPGARRPAAVLGAAVLAAVAVVPAAAAAPKGGCDGVLVVVDPGPLGGPVREACAEGAGGAAADLVRRAGVAFAYTEGQPFVCRVDARPGPEREDCRGTPPADAYWGLFWSDRGSDEWSYSALGLAALRVPRGGAVGWRFQDGGPREEPQARLAGGAGPSATLRATAAPESEAGSSPSVESDGSRLQWVAAGALLVLAAAAGVLARRRRG